MGCQDAAATQTHLYSTSGAGVALQVEGTARRAWIVSLTPCACFNHWGAHRAWGSGLEWSCALEESPVVYSNEHRMAKADQVTGTQYPSFSLSNAMYSSTSFPITGMWKKWWDGTEYSPSCMGSEVCGL